MQLASTFILVALFSIEATSVLALPVDSRALSYNKAHEFDDFDVVYEARSFDDDYELDTREFNNEFDLDAREFDDYDYLQARTFHDRINSEESTMQRESVAIKKQEARLNAQKNQVTLQEQVHADRKILRNNNAFGPGSRRPSSRIPAFRNDSPAVVAGRPSSRFQNKINTEQRTMHLEQKAPQRQEQRLKIQRQDVKLQEQIHADRKQQHFLINC